MSSLKKCAVVPDYETGNGLRSLLPYETWTIVVMGGDLKLLKEPDNLFSDVIYLDGCFNTVLPKCGGHRTCKAWAKDLEDNYLVGMGYVLRSNR
jgi:hypothetical protein